MTQPDPRPCYTCGRLLPLSDYYRHRGRKTGQTASCKDCTRLKAAASASYRAHVRSLIAETIERLSAPRGALPVPPHIDLEDSST